MSLTLTTADAALKEFYLPAIREQLNNTNWLLSMIEKNTTDIEGRRAVLSLHVARNPSVGARSEGAALPGTNSAGATSIGNQDYAEERVPLKYNYGRIQLSGPVIRAMRSDRGSFTRAIESETRGVTKDLKRDVNRQLWGDGTGQIATFATNNAVTTLNLHADTTRVEQRQIEVGMVIDIGSASNSTSVAEFRTVTAVSFSSLPGSITISGAAVSTTNNTDFLFRNGLNPGASADNVELTGLQEIVDDAGTLFNVDPSSDPVWASYVDDNSGTNRSISESLLASVMHNVEIQSGDMPSGDHVWAMSDGVFRAYGNLLTAQKRFATSELKGGFKSLEVSAGGGSVPAVWERDAVSNTAWYLDMSHLTEFANSDWEYMDNDGAVLSRRPNVDAYEATLYKYHELTTDQRNVHGKLEDVTEAS